VIVTHYPLKFCAIWPTRASSDTETKASKRKKALKSAYFIKFLKVVKKMSCPVTGGTI
jgi:hypothetical protein